MSELRKNAAKRSARNTRPEAGSEAEPKAGETPINLLIDHMPLWARPGYLVRRLHQIHYALFFEECGDFDITPVQYGLLTSLAENPNIDQNSLGRELGIDRTNVADVLSRLKKRGLIERSRSTEDKRMVLTRLTPEGERITREMYGAMQKAQLRLLEPLLPEERNAFLTMLIRLVDGNNHLGRAIFRPT